MEADMKALIELMAKSLVDKSEEVAVAETDGEKTVIFELRVATSDIGKVYWEGYRKAGKYSASNENNTECCRC
jgi:hypothetical protein